MIDVVGLTVRGWEDLPEPQRALLRAADVLLGGRRHLDAVPAVEGQRRIGWPAPLREGLPDLLASLPAEGVVALASGDPMVSGIGSTLVDVLGATHLRIHPAVSSVALARARMGWSAESCEVVTLVGRDVARLRRAVTPGARVLVLSSTGTTPAEIAAQLVADGYGASTMSVLGDLGGNDESRRTERADSWSGSAPALNVVALDSRHGGTSAPLGRTPGLPDHAYEHDGQLTKRDVRASALAHLVPLPGQLLWDLGGGAGSVAIEWCRAEPTARAVVVERSSERSARIVDNAARLGVPSLQVVTGSVEKALTELEPPDAIFVGGGASERVLEDCWAALRQGGRLVAHAVTVETESKLLEAYRRHGGELTRLSVEVLAPLGQRLHGWQPARAVVQWSVHKTGERS